MAVLKEFKLREAITPEIESYREKASIQLPNDRLFGHNDTSDLDLSSLVVEACGHRVSLGQPTQKTRLLCGPY